METRPLAAASMVKLSARVLSGRRRAAGIAVRRLDDLGDRLRDRLVIAHGHQGRELTITCDLSHPREIAGDDGCADEHGFDHRSGDALVRGGENEDVGTLEVGQDVGLVPLEADVVLESLLADQCPHRGSGRPVATGLDDRHVGMGLQDRGKRLDQVAMALLILESTDAQDDRCVEAQVRRGAALRWGGRVQAGAIPAPPHDRDPGGVNAENVFEVMRHRGGHCVEPMDRAGS